MAADTGDNHCVRMRPKLMKDFDRLRKLAKIVLGDYFDESKIDQMRLYPGSWASEFVEGDGQNFNLCLNVIECGIKSSLRFSVQESWKNAWYFL